jgi:acyl-CoA thioesterase I
MHHVFLGLFLGLRAAASLSVARVLPWIIAIAAAVAFAGIAAVPAMAQSSDQPSRPPTPSTQAAPAAASPKCPVVPDLAHIELPLSRFAFRLAAGLPIRIVAIGSSSTAGAGASSPSGSYPSRLDLELRRHFPGHHLAMVNSGANGEEAVEMVARFEKTVIAENPHLVLWQVGTNALLRDRPLTERSTILQEGLARLRRTRADVVIVDPQFAPRVIAKGEATDAAVAHLAAVAGREKVGLFRRYALMRHWREVDGVPFETSVAPDGLHMNDWSYACFAKALGFAIVEAATRSTATAAGPAR